MKEEEEEAKAMRKIRNGSLRRGRPRRRRGEKERHLATRHKEHLATVVRVLGRGSHLGVLSQGKLTLSEEGLMTAAAPWNTRRQVRMCVLSALACTRMTSMKRLAILRLIVNGY